jgi:hypothetical protein
VRKIVNVAVAVLLGFGASNVSAAVINSTNPLDFNLVAEDFPLTGFTNANITSVSGNLTLDNAQGTGQPATLSAGYLNFTGAMPGNEYVLNGDENFDLIFSSSQTAFAMDYLDASIASTFTLTFFDGVTNVGSTSFTTSSFGTVEFIGFVSTVAFNRVEVRENDGASNSDEFFQFYTTAISVPAPGALLIFGIGAVGLACARRRWAA